MRTGQLQNLAALQEGMLTSYFNNLRFLVGSLTLCTAQHVIDLSGTGWTVTNPAGNVSVPGSLPSQTHLDLFAAGVISEWSQIDDT